MRPVYRAYHDALVATLAWHLPDLELVGIAAGLRLVAWLPTELDEAAVIEAARGRRCDRRGRALRDRRGDRGGLIFASPSHTERAIANGVTRLARATPRW